MFEILNAEQSRQVDTLTIENGTPGFQLMESAGAAVSAVILKRFKICPVLVLCGPGNNGGDGFVIAWQLKKAGWPVRVACLVKRAALKNDAARAAKSWDADIETLNSNLSLKETGLIVDAVFGTGFLGTLEPEMITLFDKVRGRKIPVIAVDIPSGINATTGNVAAGTLGAVLTLTFTRKKPAHLLLPAKILCGEVQVALIGISDKTVNLVHDNVFENHPSLWIKEYPQPHALMHKYDRGHVVVAGGSKRTGAACLAAAAAQKIGAGLVSIAAPAESAFIYSCYRASIMVDSWGTIEELKAILRDVRKNTVILGPGAGTDGAAKEMMNAALAFGKTAVLDADVFTAYQSNPKELFEKISQKCILTPHEGEFERLFPDVTGSKLDRTRKAAKICNAIVLLKGADSVLAAPDGRAIINSNAPPTLATGGSGDVLSGLIAGLAAQGMPPFLATAAATWLHGEAAEKYGFCLTAEDIISTLNQCLSQLFPTLLPNT
jgi:NAD(P)H-hydrate epimerase